MIEKIDAFKCLNCNKVYLKEDIAKDCCAPKFCQSCGKQLNNYMLKCDSCIEKQRFEKAEKLNEWEGKVYHNDEYYDSVEEFIESCEDNENEIPEYIYVAEPRKWKGLNIDLDSQLEDEYEDAIENIVEITELEEFLKKWNEKQNIISFVPNFKKVVMIKKLAEEG